MSTAAVEKPTLVHFRYRCTRPDCRHEYDFCGTVSEWLQGTQPCPSCGSTKRVRLIPGDHGMDPATSKKLREYADRTDIESNTLPLHTPGADSYSPEGKPRFNSKRKLRYVGERFGAVWD